MNLAMRSLQKELLDGNDFSAEDLYQNLRELDVINTWLGGHAVTLKGFRHLLGDRKEVVVCEIGCGGGDNLAAIQRWSYKNDVHLNMIGIDLREECIAFAGKRREISATCTWKVSDYRDVSFAEKPDIIFSSLFCHHFSHACLIDQLRWMRDHSKVGFFINDLHRHALAYWSIRSITALFSRSHLVKHDAPLSVARGFVKNEWKSLMQEAGIAARVNWHWAFRHLIICKHDHVV